MKKVILPSFYFILLSFNLFGQNQFNWIREGYQSTCSEGIQSTDIAVDQLNNIYTTGIYGSSNVLFATNYYLPPNDTLKGSELSDNFLIKYNNSGLLQWKLSVVSQASEGKSRIDCDQNGNVFFASQISTSGAGQGVIKIGQANGTFINSAVVNHQNNGLLVKYNASGMVQWYRQFYPAPHVDSIRFHIEDVKTDAAGDVYICGNYAGTVVVDGTSTFRTGSAYTSRLNRVFIAKYNGATGALVWWKENTPISDGENNQILNLYINGSDVYGYGFFRKSNSGTNPTLVIENTSLTPGTSTEASGHFIINYSTFGTFNWVNWGYVSGTSAYAEYKLPGGNRPSITGDNLGNIYILQNPLSASSGIVYNFNSSVLNYGWPATSSGSTHIMLAKYNSNGVLQYAKGQGTSGGTNYNNIQGLQFKPNGRLYAAVGFLNTIRINGNNIPSNGGRDVLLMEIDTAANTPLSAFATAIKQYGISGDDYCRGLELLSTGVLAYTGFLRQNSSLSLPLLANPYDNIIIGTCDESTLVTGSWGRCISGTNNTDTSAICENQTKTLSATTNDGSWSIVSGGGSISGTTYTPANISVNTNVIIRYADACGITSDITFAVNVRNVASNTTSTTAICENQTKALVGNPTGGTWSIVSGGGSISGTTYTPPNVSANTNITVRYTIPANGACPATTSDRVFTVNYANSSVSIGNIIATLCENASHTFNANLSGGNWSVIGSLGTINTSGQYTAPSVSANTTVRVVYTVPGMGTCPSVSDTTTFIVNDNPNNINITSNTDTICVYDSKALSVFPTGGTWSIVNGTGTINTNNYVPSSSLSTDENIVLVYFLPGANSCPNITDTLRFVVRASIPNAQITSIPDTICLGESTTLIVSTTANNVAWYTNSQGNGTPISTSTNFTVSPLVDTKYYVFGYSSNMCNSSIADSVNIIVRDTSIIANQIISSHDTACGISVTLTVQGGSLGYQADWAWYTDNCGGNSIGSGNSVMVSPTSTTTYYVRAEGICDTTFCVSKTIIVASDADASWNPPSFLCVGSDPINLNNQLLFTSTPGGVWSGNGINGNQFNPQLAGVGQHTITYIAGNAPCQDSVSHTIDVINDISITANNDFYAVVAETNEVLEILNNDNPNIGNLSILQGPFNGNYTININNISYISNNNFRGFDSIQYILCDTNCSNSCDTAWVRIKVDANVFNTDDDGNIGSWGVTPNGDGINDVLYIDGLHEFPNNSIIIYNRWGEELYTASPYENDWNGLNKDVTNGTYFFILKTDDKNYKGFIHYRKD